jgi:2-oxoglutarate/2-oxoacid ferredoxin oxidoreductase subunit alpha
MRIKEDHEVSENSDHGRKVKKKQIKRVTLRFAGDSGDGMQLAGERFTDVSAIVGNDISTLPDFPAEIRAPIGTLPGVSGFQINFSDEEILTPGDTPDVLIAMNPAALKVNLKDMKRGATLIVNEDSFTPDNLKKAGWKVSPFEDHTLDDYQLFRVKLTQITREAVKDLEIKSKEAERSKNFTALGLVSWIYGRPLEPTLDWIKQKFVKRPEIIEANTHALKAGYHYGDITEAFSERYEVKKASLAPGTYRKISGNEATVLGLITACKLAELPMFYGSYPITPASDILHGLAPYKEYGIKTFQAEDEIAAVGAALGASFGGSLGVTGTSGPGMCLKAETINLAVMVELPLVILNIQRGGPSTGLPTKTEQSDLLFSLFGRNGESPIPVLAPQSSADCFTMAMEACRIAIEYMTPVIFLSDGFLANSSEPWLIPSLDDLPHIQVKYRTEPEGFFPYLRDQKTLARPWVKPGTPGLEHRIGGIEKAETTGHVSYDPDNHDRMVHLRQEKVDRIAKSVPAAQVEGDEQGDLLVLGWGSTYGAIRTAVESARKEGKRVSACHLRYLNPFPSGLEKVLKGFKKVLIPEGNLGQLKLLIRSRFLVDAVGLNRISGRPLLISEVEEAMEKYL